MTDDHDPLPRRLPGETHLTFLARDALLPGIGRIYAIARERGPDHEAKAHAALDAMLLANKGRAPKPHKDKEHAWSIRRVADQAEEWYRHNMLGKSQSGKINTDVAESAEKPAPTSAPLIFENGTQIVLTAPVHYKRGNDLVQILRGCVGTIRDVHTDLSEYIVAFDKHPEHYHAVPFDRCAQVDAS